MELKLTPKNVLFDLMRIFPQIEIEIGNEEKYKLLINYLKLNNILKIEISKSLFLKKMSKEIGLSLKQIDLQLVEIHKRLFNNNNSIGFSFNKATILFFISLEEGSLVFKCNSLPYLPKVGDDLYLPFLKKTSGSNNFYVENICHDLFSDNHEVTIYLQKGTFNSYWHYRKHKARELKELNFKDLYKLTDFELKVKLGVWP